MEEYGYLDQGELQEMKLWCETENKIAEKNSTYINQRFWMIK